MKYIPVRKVFNTFPRRTVMGEAFALAGEKRANRDIAFTREAATTTIRWKEVA